MATMTVERRSTAQPANVWAILTDLEGSPARITGIDSVDVLTDPPFGVGTTWRETRTMMGKSSTEQMAVESVQPGSSYVVVSNAHGASYSSTMSVAPDGDGSLISMSFAAEANGTVAKFFASTVGKLFEGQTRKMLQQDLADIAAAAEAM
ncbi:MAG: SRPBCC family protein [Acidimicrobiia bacterium]